MYDAEDVKQSPLAHPKAAATEQTETGQ